MEPEAVAPEEVVTVCAVPYPPIPWCPCMDEGGRIWAAYGAVEGNVGEMEGAPLPLVGDDVDARWFCSDMESSLLSCACWGDGPARMFFGITTPDSGRGGGLTWWTCLV